MDSSKNLEAVRRYLKAIEDGTFGVIVELFTADAIVEQLPNRIYPQGVRADTKRMAEAFAKGRKLLTAQTYEIKNSVADGDCVAAEVLWTGTLAVAFGNLPAGANMRAHSAMFFQFRQGQIAYQRNYDCFEPW